MEKRYGSPPVREVVVEFRVRPDTGWDVTIPGLFFARVRDRYPIREQRRVREMEMRFSEEGLSEELLVMGRSELFSPDRLTSLQIGPRLLGVNRLSPYPGWRFIKEAAGYALNALAEEVEIKAFSSLMLRYINLIEVPDVHRGLRGYFRMYPEFGDGLPGEPSSFILGCEIPFTEGAETCRIELTDAIPESGGAHAYLLNLS